MTITKALLGTVTQQWNVRLGQYQQRLALATSRSLSGLSSSSSSLLTRTLQHAGVSPSSVSTSSSPSSVSSIWMKHGTMNARGRKRFFSNNNNKNSLPPLPPPSAAPAAAASQKSSIPSPATAKQQYLASRPKGGGGGGGGEQLAATEDPHTKLARLAQEIETVRVEQATVLDQELNKSIWRKLTDPLKRYKHSLVNVIVVTLAYVLAHKMYMNSKREQQVVVALEESQRQTKELQIVLGSLLSEQVIQDIASNCVEAILHDDDDDDEDDDNDSDISSSSFNQRKSHRGWFGTRGRTTSSNSSGWFTSTIGNDTTTNEKHKMLWIKKVVPRLQQELTQRIGDTPLPEEQRKRKAMQQVLEDNKSQLKNKKKNYNDDSSEQMLWQALQEATTTTATTTTSADKDIVVLEEETSTDGTPKKVIQKRVFSM